MVIVSQSVAWKMGLAIELYIQIHPSRGACMSDDDDDD